MAGECIPDRAGLRVGDGRRFKVDPLDHANVAGRGQAQQIFLCAEESGLNHNAHALELGPQGLVQGEGLVRSRVVFHLHSQEEPEVLTVLGQSAVEVEGQILGNSEPKMGRLDRDVGLQLALGEIAGGIHVGGLDHARLCCIGHVLAQDVENPLVAFCLKVPQDLQGLIEPFSGDVAGGELPHEGAWHQRHQA